MSLIKLRQSQPIPLCNLFTEFLEKFSGKNKLPENLKIFLNILEKNYLTLTNIESSNISKIFLSQTIQNATNYLYQLNLLISQGNLNNFNLVDFGFNWTETITQNKITSNNIWFEYYSVVYNIGIILYLIGESQIINSTYTHLTFDQAKVIREMCSQALYYFDIIKNEMGSKLTEQEKGEDFSTRGIDYVQNLCLMSGYISLMNASYFKFKQNIKNLTGLDSLNTNNLEMNFHQRLSITNEIIIYADYIINYLKSLPNNNQLLIDYFEFQKDYFTALIEYFKYEYYKAINEVEGGKLGYAITYLEKYIQLKKNYASEFPNLNKFVVLNKLSVDIENIDQELEEMKRKNGILHNPTNPRPIIIKRCEIKIQPINPNFVPNLEGVSANDLLTIISPDLISKLQITTKQLLVHFSNQLKFYSSEQTIQAKLDNINLPFKIQSLFIQKNPGKVISEYQILWKKINYIKKLNNVKYIFDILANLSDKSKELNQIIAEIINSINLLNTEDLLKLKEFGGTKWYLPRVNTEFINVFQYQLKELNDFNANKSKFESNFLNQVNIFNELNAPIKNIQSKIPSITLSNSFPMSNEEIIIVEKLDTIQRLTDKLKETIIRMQNQIENMNFLLPSYELINNGKLQETDLLFQQKERINNLMISEIKPIETNINEQLNELITISSKIVVSEGEIARKQQAKELDQNYISRYQDIVDLFFKNLLKTIHAYITLIGIFKKTHQEINKAIQYINEREVLQHKLLQNILRIQVNKEIKPKQFLPFEQPNSQYKELLNELAQLGIDVAYLMPKFENLNMK